MRQENEMTPLSRPFQIAAVLKEHPQSYLKFDMLTGIGQDYYGGGVALLRVSPSFDKEAFAQKIKADGVPTLQQEKGRYYFYSLQESYFQHYPQESFPYIARSQQSLLLIGLISALLILLIACSNYINLSFSRILQQIRIIHTQKLMGDELPAVSGYIPHGRHRFPAIVADRPRPDPRFQPDHVREDHHRIFPKQAGAACHLRTDPGPVRYPCLLHKPENHQPDG